MGLHKLLKPDYMRSGTVVGQEIEIPDADLELYVLNGVVAGSKSALSVELPDDYPGRDDLIAAGHKTVLMVSALTDEQLNGVSGIGKETIKKIREYSA